MTPAETMLQAYIDAEVAVLGGKEYQHNGKIFKREDLDKIQAGRREWQTQVNNEKRLARTGSSLSVKTASFN
jgi:hypothetical protein